MCWVRLLRQEVYDPTLNSEDKKSLSRNHGGVIPTSAGNRVEEDREWVIMAGFPLDGTEGLGTKL